MLYTLEFKEYVSKNNGSLSRLFAELPIVIKSTMKRKRNYSNLPISRILIEKPFTSSLKAFALMLLFK